MPETEIPSATVVSPSKPKGRRKKADLPIEPVIEKVEEKVVKADAPDKFAAARLFKRNDLGLVETVNYVFDESGSINWRSTIPKEFICINTEWFASHKKDMPSSTEGLKDYQLLILLGGLKWAAKVRGFRELSFSPVASNDGCTVMCTITWAQNYESPSCKYTEIASCNPRNGSDFSLKFAETVAANRAFSRCVRNYLNINIVSDEEVDNSDGKEPSNSPSSTQAVPVSMKFDPVSVFLKTAKEAGMNDVKAIADFIAACDIESLKPIVFETEQDLRTKLSVKEAKTLLVALKEANKPN